MTGRTAQIVTGAILAGAWVASGCRQRTSAPTTSQAEPRCYVGPIEVRVVDPSGKPAPHVEVGVFGATWSSSKGEYPPPRNRKHRTDDDGVLKLESVRECMAPTFFYTYDEARRLAGFCLVERLDDLAHLQTVRLEPARWVTGRIISNELKARGTVPNVVCAHLTPIKDARRRARWLRFVTSPSRPFRFLVPPGGYALRLYGYPRTKQLVVEIRVLPGSTPLDLGAYDLPLSRLARLTGQPAPEWDVMEWSDGKSRTLAGLRGRPVLLGFWQKNSAPANALRRVFDLHGRLRDTDVVMLLIHAPEPGGPAAVQRYLDENLRSDAAVAELDLEMANWPFPCGIDRPARSGARYLSGLPVGQSQEPYGKTACPTFILIDRSGTIVADSDMRAEDWEAALANERRTGARGWLGNDDP